MHSKLPDDLLRLFETMAKNGFSWSNERGPVSQSNNAESETIKALTRQISNITKQMAKVSTVSSSSSSNNAANLCDTCGVPEHYSSTYPQVYEDTNALYSKPPSDPHSNRCNAGYRHPNLSYSSTNVLNAQHQQAPYQHPPPYKQYAQPAQPSLKFEIEDLRNFLCTYFQNNV